MPRRIVTVAPLGPLVAARDMTLHGVAIKKGDVVDVSKLRESKVAQLLDHRLLRPAQ